MPLTVAQFAEQKGISKQAVYSAIARRPDISEHTFQGVSNGKSAQFLDDTAITLLENTMRFPQKNSDMITNELRANVLREKAELTQGIVNQVSDNVREHILSVADELERRIESSIESERVTDLKESHKREIEQINADRMRLQKELEVSNIGITTLREENHRLCMDLKTSQMENDKLISDNASFRQQLAKLYEEQNKDRATIEQLKKEIEWLRSHPVKNLFGGKSNG